MVYTPEPMLRRPGVFLRELRRDLWASRELTWTLFVRDIKARYRQAALGVLWAFLPPVATAVVFVLLHRAGAVNVRDTGVPYPAFVMTGTVLWFLFAGSLTAPLTIVSKNKSVLAKINFPREALILAAVGETLFDFLVRCLILAAVFVYYGVSLTGGAVPAVVPLFVLMLAGFVLGTLLTPLGLLYTDIAAGLPLLINLWFFATPVVYPMPEGGPYAFWINCNPAAAPLSAARDLLLHGSTAAWPAVLTVCGLSLVGMLFVWVLYRLALPLLIERMPA